MLATECSNPLEKKASKHRQTIIDFVVSSLLWKVDQTAKQTKILHKIARRTNWNAGADILAAAALVKTAATAGKSNPEAVKIQASKLAPSKLPIQQTTQRIIAWTIVTFF